MEIEFQKKWDNLFRKLKQRFDEGIDIQAILFIIGLQELGLPVEKLSKDQKVDIIHIAVCALLEPYGYYNFIGRDQDGWPHWELENKLPQLTNLEQERLIKEGIIGYLGDSI